MIVKISATENLGDAPGYNPKKVNKKEATLLLAHGLCQNRAGKYAMSEVLVDMQASVLERCGAKKTVFHCSLNPHPNGKLSDETLSQIAKEYMAALGYSRQPYTMFKHDDITREYIHIVSLRVDGNSRKINDKFEGRRSRKITDALEKKYRLIPSTEIIDKPLQGLSKVDMAKGNIKKQVASIARSILERYRLCSLGELNAILAQCNLAIEEVKTEFRGKKYDRLVYIPIGDRGGKVSTPFHTSEIGHDVGYTAVQNRIQRSKQTTKPLIPAVKEKVLQVVHISPRTEEILRHRLKEQDLRTVIRKNEGGCIYGIMFIDDEDGITLNGSRLDKGYSANTSNACLSSLTYNPFMDKVLYGTSSAQLKEEAPIVQPLQSDVDDRDNLVDELVDDIVGDLPLGSSNDDWKEAVWQRGLRRQSKIHLRRRKR